MESTLTKSQVKTFGPKVYTENGRKYRITAKVRYDDECGNGHNSFSITADIDRWSGNHWADDCGGCCHDEVAKRFPELAPLIKWHLCSSDGPMHYVANTIYMAGNRDHWGLLKGEVRQMRNNKGLPMWCREHVKYEVEALAECPTDSVTVSWQPCNRTGEGKERELNHARSCAIWPDATDEELTTPGLKERLEARLPQLLADFKAAVESLGFTF